MIDMSNLVTVRVAAQAAGKDPETIKRWIWQHKLDARKYGLIWFIAKGDLAAYLGIPEADLFAEE